MRALAPPYLLSNAFVPKVILSKSLLYLIERTKATSHSILLLSMLHYPISSTTPFLTHSPYQNLARTKPKSHPTWQDPNPPRPHPYPIQHHLSVLYTAHYPTHIPFLTPSSYPTQQDPNSSPIQHLYSTLPHPIPSITPPLTV